MRTWQGWLYLAAVMDCYSRRIGRPDARGRLVEAPEMAVARRRPRPGLVHHSRARSTSPCASASAAARQASTARRARRESLRQRRLRELLRHAREGPASPALLRDTADARTALSDYVEAFNNPIRLHSTLGYVSPVEYERMREEEKGGELPSQTCPPKRGHSKMLYGRSPPFTAVVARQTPPRAEWTPEDTAAPVGRAPHLRRGAFAKRIQPAGTPQVDGPYPLAAGNRKL